MLIIAVVNIQHVVLYETPKYQIMLLASNI